MSRGRWWSRCFYVVRIGCRLAVRPYCRHRPRCHQGFDAGKKLKGRKRFTVTDTLGLLLSVHVVAASMQGHDGAKPVAVDQARSPRRQEGLGRPGLRRPPSRVGRSDSRPRPGDRPQGPRPARLPGPAQPVGNGAHLLVALRPPAPRPGLRDQPGPLRDDDPMGHDRHHGPPAHPGRCCDAPRPTTACAATFVDSPPAPRRRQPLSALRPK